MNRLKSKSNIISTRSLIISYSMILGVYLVIFLLHKYTYIISDYYMQVINLALINGLMAMSLNVVNGITGQFCLGHAGFMSIGAYISAMMTIPLVQNGYFDANGFSGQILLILACLVAGIVAGFVGLLIGLPSLRLRGDYLAIITLGFGEIVRTIWRVVPQAGLAKGLTSIPQLSNFTFIYIVAVLCMFLYKRFMSSTYGRSCLAIRENELAAEVMGVNTTKIKIIAFVLAAFTAGVAGALYSHLLRYIQPDMFNYTRSNDFLVYLYAGGIGSFTSGFLGAFALTIIPEVLRFLVDWRLVLYAAVLVIIMINRPQGILGGYEFPFMRYDDSFGRFPKPLKRRKGGKGGKGGNAIAAEQTEKVEEKV